MLMENIIAKYNKKNPLNELDFNEIFDLVSNKNTKITFVMAYRNESYKNHDAIEKIRKSTSNIAIFSVVQTVREILNYQRFDFKMIDISQIKKKPPHKSEVVCLTQKPTVIRITIECF